VSIETTMATQDGDFTQSDASLILPVDREHSGIRLAGCASLIITGLLIFGLSTLLLNLSPILGLFISLLAAMIVTTLLERSLKGNWPSGRELVVDSKQVSLRKQGEIERQLDASQQVNVLAWHFVVERSRRVRKGWHVVGFALEQENEFIPIYTLASPEDFESINDLHSFTKLERPKPADNKTKTTLRQAGEQRRLLEAEQDRGYNGAELSVDDFKTYLTYLKTQHSGWMVS